jgi:hypothetical protein
MIQYPTIMYSSLMDRGGLARLATAWWLSIGTAMTLSPRFEQQQQWPLNEERMNGSVQEERILDLVG